MIIVAKKDKATVAERKPDCCTALRGRKNLDVQTNVMVADPSGCE
jgi:hypothetical protein